LRGIDGAEHAQRLARTVRIRRCERVGAAGELVGELDVAAGEREPA